MGLQKLLNTKTESDFFITICDLLRDYYIDGITSRTELVSKHSFRPSLELTFYMTLTVRRPSGRKGYSDEKVWVFTLSNVGELQWEKADFEPTEPDILILKQRRCIVGLEEIKRVLCEAKTPFGSPLIQSISSI